jgi:Ribbon-helix-helix protein, copG family
VIRTQISLPAELMAQVRELAGQRGISLAALVRESLTVLLAEDADRVVRQRAMAAVGGFHSGHRDVSESHDDVLAETASW